MIPCYIVDDQPGDDLQCRCVLPGEKHPACENCLILIGPAHVERLVMAAELPRHADHFNDERGCWERGIKPLPAYVCGWCADLLARKPQCATLRILPKTRKSQRLPRDLAWRREHPATLPPTRPGEFLRLGKVAL